MLLLAGCAQVDIKPNQFISELELNDFHTITDNRVLPIRAWWRIKDNRSPVHIYIEGDGHAWSGRGRPSLNPTPNNPVALKLALQDPADNVIYIARPCQFISLPAANCHYSVWTTKRYAALQIAAVKSIVGQIANPTQAVVLIGFSGGGYIALSLVAEFEHVEGVITVAGNINLEVFARYHKIMRPDSFALPSAYLSVPQLYLTGDNDRVISPALTREILKHLPQDACYKHKVFKTTDHSGPWSIPWAQFDALRRRCES
jgi:pimeloyl-ACP methyl ester carboxylesterase